MIRVPCCISDSVNDPDCNVVNARVFECTDTGIRWLWTTQDANGNGVQTTGTLCFRVLGSNTWIQSSGGTSSSFNVVEQGLTPGTTYEWQAKSELPNGDICSSSINQVTTKSDDQTERNCTVKANDTYAAWEVELEDAYGGWIVNGAPNNSGVSGDSYEWKGGNNFFLAEAGQDILKYTVCITDPGVYQFKIRSFSDTSQDPTRPDLANDVWVRFPTGVDVAGQVDAVQGWIKVFRNATFANQWTWVSSAEHNGNQWQTTQQFFSAGNHCIELSGRSNCHSIDRIVLCKVGAVANPDAVANSPLIDCDDTVKELPPNAPYNDSCPDLIALHFDVAPDLDDLHAIAAGCSLSNCFDIDPCVVIGTYGLFNGTGNHMQQYLTDTNLLGQSNSTYQGQTRQQLANAVATAAFGAGGYLDTGNGWTAAVNATAAKWKIALDNGCDVWVAEGGPMDFTADVLARLIQLGCTSAQLNSNVHVVQHANFNITQTLPANFTFVQNNSDYIIIPNGNFPNNGSADLEDVNINTTSSNFAQWARASACGGAWDAALDRFSAKVDFSDTVELLHILGIGTGTVSTIQDFCDFVD